VFDSSPPKRQTQLDITRNVNDAKEIRGVATSCEGAARVSAVQISPSILSADFANLQAELERIANADWAHVDVMDAHFVPNLTLGLPIVEALAKVSPIPLDCHLMIDDPDRWAPGYAEAGAQSVTFHIEAAREPRELARTLRAAGARAGMAIKPGTPFAPYEDLLPDLDMVLVMTVEPGFGGQSFMADQMPKVAQVREAVSRLGGEIWVQVDGGVSASTIEQCAEAGADVFVAGSAVYGAEDAAAAVDRLRALASAHAH
jgi:ribulose-phosphate 3-epimerase